MSSRSTDNNLTFIPEESGAESASTNWRQRLFQLNIDTSNSTSQGVPSGSQAHVFGSVRRKQRSPVLSKSKHTSSGRRTPTSTRFGPRSSPYNSDTDDDDEATTPSGRRTPLSPFSDPGRRRLALSRTNSEESTQSGGGSRTPTGLPSDPRSHPARSVHDPDADDRVDRGGQTTDHQSTSTETEAGEQTDFEEDGPKARARLEQEKRLKDAAEEASAELTIQLDIASLNV